MSGVTAMGVLAGAAVAGTAVSAYSSMKSGDAAADAASDATQASASQLAFQKAQQAKWDEVFGPTQDRLKEYYGNLDPNDVAATNVVNMQKAYQSTQVQLDKMLAQRGIGESGLAANMSQNLIYQNEVGKAEARALAPQQVAQQQSNFLGLGLGATGALQAGMSSAYSNQINSANNTYNSAMIQGAQANQSFGSSISALGQGIAMYNQPKSYTPGLASIQTLGYTPIK